MTAGVFLFRGLKGQGDRAVSRTWRHRGWCLQLRDKNNQCWRHRRITNLAPSPLSWFPTGTFNRLNSTEAREYLVQVRLPEYGADRGRRKGLEKQVEDIQLSGAAISKREDKVRYSFSFDSPIYLFDYYLLKAYARVYYLHHGPRFSLLIKD